MKIIKLIICLALGMLLACGEKTVLNDEELSWMGNFKEGDTLVLRSENGLIDSLIINNITNEYDDYDPILKHDHYLPNEARVNYFSLSNPSVKKSLIYLKKPTPDSVSFYLSYSSCGYSGDIYSNSFYNKFKKGDTIRFECQFGDGVHFWSKNGLVKHIDSNGIVWNRIK